MGFKYSCHSVSVCMVLKVSVSEPRVFPGV